MKNTYIQNLLDFLKQYEGETVRDLLDKLNISTNAKSTNFILSKALISNYEGKDVAAAKISRFKLNIKTIQLKENGNPKEAMSFAPIDFSKIINESWNCSAFRNYLAQDFVFFVFKVSNGVNYFIKVIHWIMPLDDLDGETKLVWEDTKKKITDGTVIKEIKNGKYVTWFLGEKVTNICHVRPHGANGADVAKLPVKDRLTGYTNALKYSFWFNHNYLKNIVYNS